LWRATSCSSVVARKATDEDAKKENQAPAVDRMRRGRGEWTSSPSTATPALDLTKGRVADLKKGVLPAPPPPTSAPVTPSFSAGARPPPDTGEDIAGRWQSTAAPAPDLKKGRVTGLKKGVLPAPPSPTSAPVTPSFSAGARPPPGEGEDIMGRWRVGGGRGCGGSIRPLGELVGARVEAIAPPHPDIRPPRLLVPL
jgi:hypothetical protein